MNAINDALKEKLTPSAQVMANVFLETALGLDVTSIDDPLTKSQEVAIEWAIQGTHLTPDELTEYVEGTDNKDTKEHIEASERYFEAMKAFQAMYEPYKDLMKKLRAKRNSIYFVREETEQNAWRMAYFIKELRISELQKKHDEPIDNKQMLLENLTPEDMESIQQSYDHISIGLAMMYAWQDFITFISERFDYEQLTEAIKEDAPSVAPIQALRAEAGRTQDFITTYAFEWREHEQLGQVTANKGIDEKLEYYMPLIIFTSLLDIKRTPKESYQKIMSVYADYTVEEITENIEKILADFLREIMKQNEGAE